MVSGLLGMLSLIFLLLLGLPIGISAALVGLIGLVVHTGSLQTAMTMAGLISWEAMSKYSLTVVPLFIFMGQIAAYAGFMDNIFNSMQAWFGRLKGGMAIATIVAGAGFGAMNGSSTASAVILGKITVPQMRKYGYSAEFSTGCVAASGTLAALIPPSVVIVIYGIMTETSIGKLLLAAYIPGFFSALIYAIGVYVIVSLKPEWAPGTPKAYSWREKISSIRTIFPILVITAILIGGLYTGAFTATEAGAIGCLAMLIMAFARGKLGIKVIFAAIKDSVRITVLVLIIVLGVNILARFFAYTGIATVFARYIASLNVPGVVVLAGFIVLYFILGCFLDVIGMLALTLPIIIPVSVTLNWDPIWLGILIVKACEVGMLTPPVGLNVYALATVTPDIPVMTIFRGSVYFFLMDIFTIAALIAFPSITLILPNLMKGG